MKKFINTLLIFCMCFGALCISYGAQEYGTEDTSIKDNNNSYEKIEILDSVPNNFGFEIEKDKYLTDKNIDSYVSVKDVVGDSVSLTVEDAGDSYYILPKEPYIAGKSYNINLNNVNFKNASYGNSLTFTIESPVVENVSFSSNVKTFEKDIVKNIDTENKILYIYENYDEQLNVGDILIIPTVIHETDFFVEKAYKVEKIEGAKITYSTPEIQEIYSQFEINNTYTAEQVKPYSDDEIKYQILQNPEIKAVSKAVYDMTNNTSKRNFSTFNTQAAPEKINVEFNSFDPLDVMVTIKWKLGDNVNLIIVLRYEKTTTVSFYANDAEKRQITSESGKWTISIDITGDVVSPDVQKLFSSIRYRNKYIVSLKESYDADKQLHNVEKQLKNPNLTQEEKDMLALKLQIAQSAVDYANLDKKFLQMENKKAAMLELKTLTQYYKTSMKESGSVIKFVQLFFPVAPGVAFTTDAGAILDFSVSASLNSKLVINSIQEVGTVSTANSQEDFYNAFHQVSGFVGICGEIEFKIGAQIGVGVTIAGVFNLNLTLEGGLYFNFSALGAICFGDSASLGLSEEESDLFAEASVTDNSSIVGTINYDVGSYYLLNYKVSLDLWVIETSKTFEIIGDKISFIKNDEESNFFFRELVFENETNLKTFDEIISSINEICNKGTSYDPTPVFELPQGAATVSIPKIFIRRIDLISGDVTYSPVDAKQLSYINEEKVFFNELTCYARDYYEPVIDNRVNIRLEDNDSGDLVLPIRIVREPIAVQSINLKLEDNTTVIGLTEKKLMSVELLPYNATYANYSYKINKIEKPNHTYYNGNLTQYATIENNYLTTTDEIEIGSRIFITAVATEDDVESSTLVVTVNRIEIERIQFKDDFYRNDINLGEKLGIELSVFPTNATFNILNDETVDVYISKNKECATINKIDDFHYELYAFDNNENIGKVITVTVAIGDYLRTFSYTIGAIPIESMTLYNAETQTELDSTISLTRGGILKVSAVINPVNASLKEVSYNIFADIPNYGRYVSIDSNGTLKISDNAPFGMEIFLSATAMHKSTGSYKIVVEQIPVESVMLTSEYSYIEKNTIISLEAYVYPEKADIESTTYKIVNEAPGVFISGNRLFASNNAVADSYVEVVAVVNGVQSNKLVIYIVEDISDTVSPSEDETPATDEFEYITSDNRQVVGKNSEQRAND